VETRIEEIFDEWTNRQTQISRGDNVIIGVSGGPDSLCLLFLMYKYSKRAGFNIMAVHFNHKLRGEKADEDEVFVKQLCDYLKIKCIIARADIRALSAKSGMSIEETGRLMRYKAFAKTAKSVNGIIAVAHHMDDNAETVLLNLVRGSNVKGITGMTEVSEVEGCTVIRPLLNGTHAEIMEFLDNNEIRFMEDETNEDITYARNRIRQLVIPQLKEVNSKASEHIIGTANELLKIESLLEKLTDEAYSEVVSKKGNEIIVNTYKLFQYEEVIQQRILYEALGRAIGNYKDISRVHVEDLMALCQKQTGKQIDLPGGFVAVKNYYDISIFEEQDEEMAVEEDEEEGFEISLDVDKLFQNTNTIALPDGSAMSILVAQVTDENRAVFLEKNEYTKAFDYDTIKGNLRLGKKAQGDYIYLKEGKKLLKKFFVDEKIPQDKRDEILILKDEESVLWIVGYRIGENFKVTDDTKLALLVRLSGGKYGR